MSVKQIREQVFYSTHDRWWQSDAYYIDEEINTIILSRAVSKKYNVLDLLEARTKLELHILGIEL